MMPTDWAITHPDFIVGVPEDLDGHSPIYHYATQSYWCCSLGALGINTNNLVSILGHVSSFPKHALVDFMYHTQGMDL